MHRASPGGPTILFVLLDTIAHGARERRFRVCLWQVFRTSDSEVTHLDTFEGCSILVEGGCALSLDDPRVRVPVWCFDANGPPLRSDEPFRR